jgi:hypothetical protein
MSTNLFRKAIKEALEEPTKYPKGKITLTYTDGPGAGYRSMFYKMSIDVPGSFPKDISAEDQAAAYLRRECKVTSPIPDGMQDREGLAALKAELNANGYDFSVFEMDVS